MAGTREERLVSMNSLEEPMYRDKVRKAVREEMFPEDEIAILRKAVVSMYEKFNKLVDIVATLHPEEVAQLELVELEEYNAFVESVKKSYKNF